MELRHRCRVAEASCAGIVLVAMVSKTACDGFRVGKSGGVKPISGRDQKSDEAEGRIGREEQSSCRDKDVQTRDVTGWHSELIEMKIHDIFLSTRVSEAGHIQMNRLQVEPQRQEGK